MYSTDRKDALDRTIYCLENMELYERCQKILVVDGKINDFFAGWDIVEVPRVNKEFCWSYMWDAGVNSAKSEKIVYLDSDRMLPRNYLSLINDNLEDDIFVFTSNHFMMLEELPKEKCQKLLDGFAEEGFFSDEFLSVARFEARFKTPVHGPGKNVMSGSTGFTKKTYWKLGGVDPWYRGHGAYADTDFHFTAYKKGCKFIDLGVPEFHFPHKKKSHKGDDVGEMKLRLMGLDNFIYYCGKWGLPLTIAENIGHECNIRRPDKYVAKKYKEIFK